MYQKPFYEHDIYAFVLKLDGGGNILWQRNIGGKGLYQAYGVKESIESMVTVTGKSVLEGSADLDFFVARLESTGSATVYCDLITDTGFEAIDSDGTSYEGEAMGVDTEFPLLGSEAAALSADGVTELQCPI